MWLLLLQWSCARSRHDWPMVESIQPTDQRAQRELQSLKETRYLEARRRVTERLDSLEADMSGSQRELH